MNATATIAATLLHETFEQRARLVPDKTALIVGAERFTYAEIERRVNHLAAVLQQHGVRRGDRVTTFLDNGVDAVVAMYAILKCGGVLMPVNSLAKRDSLARLMNDARPSALITHAALRAEFEPALAKCASIRVCLVAGPPPKTPSTFVRSIPYPAPGTRIPEFVDPGTAAPDLAALIYTSGTTGEPKGVMHTHASMMAACRSVLAYLPMSADDVILCALPLTFSYGLYQVLLGFQLGATVLLERSFAFPVKVLDAMVRERVTVFPGVPTMFTMLTSIGGVEERDLGSLRIITNAAAALPEERVRRLRALFPAAQVYLMYGQTECKRVTYLAPEEVDRRPASVGRGMPYQEHWLVDDAGARLPHGSTGELVIRGAHVMRGYWEKPDDTRAKLRVDPATGDAVMYTGDIFRTDAEGFLYFVARKDDIIKSRGEKVSPREVENALYEMPGVLEVAVIGVPDDVLGQAVKAFVTLKPGVQCTERDVIKYCLSKLESYMAPKHVVFVDALPKTDNGKIKKTALA
ncbi:MAG TPA: class I adenylate-forming enzyme family protein [Gemmatimonadaceae bacterium]|nr:class I adenylate-forming enzyme family protein [Gemmatimonadaceae bacterium]